MCLFCKCSNNLGYATQGSILQKAFPNFSRESVAFPRKDLKGPGGTIAL